MIAPGSEMSEQTQSDSDNQKNDGSGESGAEVTVSPPNEPIPTVDRQNEPGEQTPDPHREAPDTMWRRPDILSLVFDGILTATAILGAIFLVVQYRQTSAALGEAKEANRIAKEAATKADAAAREQDARYLEQFNVAKANADAAQAAASAAQESVRLSEAASQQARDAFKLEQRPWLLVSESNVYAFKWPDTKPEGYVVVRNLGKTPALRVRFSVFMRILGGGFSGPPGPPAFVRVITGKPAEDRRAASVIIGPSVDTIFNLTTDWTEAQAKALDAGAAVIELRGRIQYSDLWGEDHFTEYCTISLMQAGEQTWGNCNDGNDAR
jgi:hypothetical protein